MFDIINLTKSEISLVPFTENNPHNKIATLSRLNALTRHLASKLGICTDIVKIKGNKAGQKYYITKSTAIDWIVRHRQEDRQEIKKSISPEEIRTLMRTICSKKPETTPNHHTPPINYPLNNPAESSNTEELLDPKDPIKSDEQIEKKTIKTAAKQGDPESQWLYAQYLLDSSNLKHNRKGLKYLRLLAENGHSEAANILDAQVQKINQKEFLKIKKKAEKPSSTLKDKELLARFYLDGYGTTKDLKLSMDWFLKAEQQGELTNASYYRSLGIFYQDGEIVEQNSQKAFQYLRKAATKGDRHAQRLLGLMFYHGYSVKPNYIKAFKWFVEASKQNDPLSNAYIGFMLMNGNGTTTCIKTAYRKLHQAWQSNDPKTQEFIRGQLTASHIPQEEIEKIFSGKIA